MKIKYNAPTTLTFSLICGIVLLLGSLIPGLMENWFSAPPRGAFSFGSVSSYVRLFTHVLGHADINHLMSNLVFILLLGPILEASYGSVGLLVMMILTALVTGILNALLFSSGLLGASGVVFMMILLASFTNFSKGEIPVTFILVMLLFLGREIINAFRANDISEFAHIIGGLCGSVFGFFRPAKT